MKVNYRKANRELLKVWDYVEKEIQPLLCKGYNLKLYSAFCIADDLFLEYPILENWYSDSMDLFNSFCELSYDVFLEDLQENNIKDCRKYVRHTSLFYLTDNRDYDFTLGDLLNNVYGGYFNSIIRKKALYPDIEYYGSYKEALEASTEELEYIISGEFLQDLKNYFHDPLYIAHYIKDFKYNQVGNFREWVECEVEAIQDQLEIEKEAEKENKLLFAIETAAYTMV